MPPPLGPAPIDPELLAGAVIPAELGEQMEGTATGCLGGDEAACRDLGDSLVTGCSAGSGLSCDALSLATPAGSSHERFAATCAGRFPEDAGTSCASLLD